MTNILNEDYGFIILRHVNSSITNTYWKECYKCIRRFYMNKIIIIDDNSNYNYISKLDEAELTNCEIVKSEYHKRGELLPYYYYYKNNFFDYAIIIHDSVFIQKYIDFNINNDILFLWHFENNKTLYENKERQIFLLNNLNNNKELFKLFNSSNWVGCFGVMSIISHKFISKIQNKYNFFNLLNHIISRPDRCCLERIFAIICLCENKNNNLDKKSFFGKIHDFIKWKYNYNDYNDWKNNKINNDLFQKYLLIKIWTGR